MATTPSTRTLIDTDVLIDYTRGVADAAAFLSARRMAGELRTSIVSAMELVRGCLNGVELRMVQRLLAAMVIVPINEAVSQRAYNLVGTYALSHALDIPDALIAATALEHELTVFTVNIRDFRMIPALDVIRPY